MSTTPWKPLVTIAIPTYNRAEKFLPIALRSACQQTYENLDIFVSDNCSHDQTGTLVASFADPRIRYHRHTSNIGAAKNVNFCVEQSRGEYTLLLMDDDAIDDDFVAACVNAARTKPDAGLIRSGARVVNGNGETTYESPNLVVGLNFTEFVLGWTEGKTAPYLCSTLFRTTPLQQIGMHSKHHLWVDVITELTIASRHGRVDIPDIKASFCMHHGELTVGASIEEWCEDSVQLLDLACELASSDKAMLRERLTPYLATLMYRVALRLNKPWPARLAACFTVKKALGTPPDSDVVREALRQIAWYKRLKQGLGRSSA